MMGWNKTIRNIARLEKIGWVENMNWGKIITRK
jgi:hypothetical protein